MNHAANPIAGFQDYGSSLLFKSYHRVYQFHHTKTIKNLPFNYEQWMLVSPPSGFFQLQWLFHPLFSVFRTELPVWSLCYVPFHIWVLVNTVVRPFVVFTVATKPPGVPSAIRTTGILLFVKLSKNITVRCLSVFLSGIKTLLNVINHNLELLF